MTADPNRTHLAVLGSPIEHSLSPVLHAAAYRQLGLPFTYTRHEVASGGLDTFLAELGPEWRGLSLTMPLKREVIPLLDHTTPLVDDLGVANTLLFRTNNSSTVRLGANTDVDGIVRPVQALGYHGDEATLIGGGATAISALTAMTRLGIRTVQAFLRDPTKGIALATLAERLDVTLHVRALATLEPDSPHPFVLSTLPGGAADPLRLRPSSPDAVLFDVAYEPWPTAVASRWSNAGGRVLNGLDMLTEQAIGQIRFFLTENQEAPLPGETEMRVAMRHAVGLPDQIA